MRQVALCHKGQASVLKFTERMKQAIDGPRGRRLYGQRMATVEPVFGNLRHNKRLNRFTLRGQPKVNAAVLPGAQHREACAPWLCAVGTGQTVSRGPHSIGKTGHRACMKAHSSGKLAG